MAVFTKQFLSGSTNGRPIQVVQTATAGDTIHIAHASAKDEIWLYAVNRSGSPVLLTIEFGGVTTGDTITTTLTAGTGPLLVIPGSVLTNSLVVRAFADVTNVVSIFGWVNRIV